MSEVAEVLGPACLSGLLVGAVSVAICLAVGLTAMEPFIVVLRDVIGVVHVLVFVVLLHFRPAVGVLLLLCVSVVILLAVLLLLRVVMLLLLSLHLWEVVLLVVAGQK